MSTMHVEVSEVINARPAAVYAVLSDYHEGHPAILLKPYFTSLTVEEGGKGEGTVIRVAMEVFGVKRNYLMHVTEPQPGRVLVEADPEQGVVTTFTVEPVDDGEKSRVTIATDSKTSPGIAGFFERLMNPPITQRIYRQELQQLDRYLSDSSR